MNSSTRSDSIEGGGRIGSGEAQIWESFSQLEKRLKDLERLTASAADTNQLNMLVFSNSRDRLLVSFMMANTAASLGMEVSMFFAFWGTSVLKKGGAQIGKKSLVERAFGWMLPNGVRRTKLSQMDMCGMGRLLMSREMKRKNVADLDELLAVAGELGVRISACEMSMNLMGIRREELIDYPNLSFCGATSFIEATTKANTTLIV